MSDISKPAGGVAVKLPERFEAFIVYCSSEEATPLQAENEPSPAVHEPEAEGPAVTVVNFKLG